MCITSLEAELSATIIGLWDIEHPRYGYRHVLAYQNAPQNLADGPNCMILPIPTFSELTQDCVLNTEDDVDLLRNMARRVLPNTRGFAIGGSGQNYTFEMGVYHLAIFNDLSADKIQNSLAQIPEDKRPYISQNLIDFYCTTYPSYPLLLCCFNNRDAKMASPILVHYPPVFPNTFMFNTLEGHGTAPVIGEPVEYHQKVLVGSCRIKEAFGDYKDVEYPDVSPELLPFLPRFVQGAQLAGRLPNNDFLINTHNIATDKDLVCRFGMLAN